MSVIPTPLSVLRASSPNFSQNIQWTREDVSREFIFWQDLKNWQYKVVWGGASPYNLGESVPGQFKKKKEKKKLSENSEREKVFVECQNSVT